MATQIKKEIKLKKPIIQIDDEVREMTDDEFAKYQADQLANAETKVKVEAEINAKKIQRQAILDRLGLTADEAKLLLG